MKACNEDGGESLRWRVISMRSSELVR